MRAQLEANTVQRALSPAVHWIPADNCMHYLQLPGVTHRLPIDGLMLNNGAYYVRCNGTWYLAEIPAKVLDNMSLYWELV